MPNQSGFLDICLTKLAPRRCLALLLVLVISCLSQMAWAKLAVNQDIEVRVASILKDMTLEQKVGQMVQGEIKDVTPEDVTQYYLGSVLNGGGSFPNGQKNSTVSDWLSLSDQYYLASLDR